VPKSYQLLIDIFRTGFQELALTGQNFVKKMSTKARYQEIFTEFVEGSKHQWYSIKPLHYGIPSLVDLLEVSAENLETLFMNAGLGKLGQCNKLVSFQPSRFESF
jgi:hypothetical protein